MTNTNATITRKAALTAAIEKFEMGDPIRVTLEKMLEQVSKTRNGETPAQAKAKAERVELMQACLDAMAAHADTDINSTWLAAHVDGVRTTQKATALMTMAVKEGKATKVYQGKKVYYTLA